MAIGVIVSAQNPESGVQITILSPGPDAYVSGPTLLRARVDPEEAASAVAFFVGGRQICVITAPPWECDWDAGPSVSEHQVRAVATLRAGGRVVQTARTKSLGYAERVNVEVVQVTVTVGDGRGRFVRGIPRSAFHISRTASRRRSPTSRPKTCRSSSRRRRHQRQHGAGDAEAEESGQDSSAVRRTIS
jgi:hypothetical protein